MGNPRGERIRGAMTVTDALQPTARASRSEARGASRTIAVYFNGVS